MPKLTPLTKYLLLFLLLSPGVWQVAFHPLAASRQWLSIPGRLPQNVTSKLASSYFTYIAELRWGGRSLHRNDPLSRVLYNRTWGALNETFDFIQFVTPKLYFAAGDGSVFSPARIEPVPSILFPLWIIGLIYLIRSRRYKVFALLILAALPAYLAGAKNLALLAPVLVIHTYICAVGFTGLFSRQVFRKPATAVISLYGLYVVAMNLWFNFAQR